MIYPFVKEPTAFNSEAPIVKLHDKFESGEKLTKEEKQQIQHMVCKLTSAPYGCYYTGGWCFDFRAHLNRYIVREKGDARWYTIYGFSPRYIRRVRKGIAEIYQIPHQS